MRLPPAGTRLAAKDSPGHRTAGVVLPDRALRSGTTPPPNCVTHVKVWVSPPTFRAIRVWPDRTGGCDGLNAHDLTTFLAVSSAMKSLNVVVPLPTHPPAPRTALNVVGS